MSDIATKLTYLNTTKQLLKENINNLGGNLTNEPFRQYASVLEGIYERLPKVSGIGASLSLSPSMVGKIKLNEIQGDTLQNGTPTPSSPVPIQSVTGLQNIEVCGKNLLNVKDGSYSYGTTNSWVVQNHEVKMSVNDITYQGGNIKLTDGTTSRWADGVDNDIAPSGTYTLSVNKTGTITFRSDGFVAFYIKIYNDDGTASTGSTLVIRDNQNEYTQTFTVDSGKHIGEVTIYSQYIQCQDVEFKIQIEKGSTATTYEPYKGNTYEVNLGKNIFNATLDRYSTNRVRTNVYSVLPNTTYTISVGTTGISVVNYYKDINKSDISDSGLKSMPYTFTTPSNCYFIQQIIRKSNDSDITLDELSTLQLEKGSQATSYSPYFTPIELNKIGDYEDSIKKSTGKQLFDKDNANVLNAYFNLQQGIISNDNTRSIYIPCKPNTTYTMQKNGSARFRIGTTDSVPIIGSSILNINSDDSASVLTITTPSNAKYLIAYIYGTFDTNSKTFDEVLDSIQIEVGSQATDYEPYGKVWYITKNIFKVVLDGTQNLTQRNDGDGSTTLTFQFIATVKPGAYGINSEYCNRFIYEQSSSSGNEGIGISSNFNEIYFQIKRSRLSSLDVAGFKAWLSSNNVEVKYIMATPIYEVITNTELINQLESLYNAKSKNGTTNINVTSEDLSMILNVSVIKGDA